MSATRRAKALVTVSTRLEPDIYQALKNRAERTGEKQVEIINKVLREALKRDLET